MDKAGIFKKFVGVFYDEESDPVFQILIVLGGMLFLAFMIMLLLGFDLFGLADLMHPMNIFKSWFAALIFLLPAIMYGMILDFMSKKESDNAAN